MSSQWNALTRAQQRAVIEIRTWALRRGARPTNNQIAANLDTWARAKAAGRLPPAHRPCRKAAYGTERAAQAAAVRVSTHLGPLRTYRCERCRGTWHLTSRAKAARPDVKTT